MEIRAYRDLPQTADPTELLDWLLYSHTTETPSCLKVVWDLTSFAQRILSTIPPREELGNHRSQWGNYRFYYIPDKMFSVNKHGTEATFYDLSQYFPEEPEPQSHTALQAKAESLLLALVELGVPDPATLSSPVAAVGLNRLLGEVPEGVPTIWSAMESHLEAYELALQCTPREWVCNYQVGHWPRGLYSYDISSAYPFHASQLLDLRDCSFTRIGSGEFGENIATRASYYGFLVGDFTVYPDHPLAYCSPFLADRGDGVLVNFVNTVPDYHCTLDEVRTLYRYELGEFRLKYGWFIHPLGGVRPRQPLADLVNCWYSQRDISPLLSTFVKRVLTGMVGKMLETHKDSEGNITEYGDLYNPIYHAICTTRTRLQVFDFIVQNEISRDELVHVGVDGVRATKYIPLPPQAPLGRWRCSGSEPAIVLSPGGLVTPRRNFKRTGYAELLVDLLERPKAHKYGKDRDIDLRNLFLNQTRAFDDLPGTGERLLAAPYLSSPVSISEGEHVNVC